MEREVRIVAKNVQAGMTAAELCDILLEIPGHVVPTVEIRINGKIKAVKVKYDTGTNASV